MSDDFGLRIGGIFERNDSTLWSRKEWVAFSKILPIEEEDLELIEKYYAARLPHKADWRRRSVITLLDNWSGELDRARRWLAACQSPGEGW